MKQPQAAVKTTLTKQIKLGQLTQWLEYLAYNEKVSGSNLPLNGTQEMRQSSPPLNQLYL